MREPQKRKTQKKLLRKEGRRRKRNDLGKQQQRIIVKRINNKREIHGLRCVYMYVYVHVYNLERRVDVKPGLTSTCW